MKQHAVGICRLAVAVCIAGLLGLAPSAFAQVGGADAIVDSGPAVQNEISLTLVPGAQAGNPQVLVAAYNDNPFPAGNGLGVSYSTDGGANWVSTQLGFPSSSISKQVLVDAFDPTVTADTQGRLFVAHISTDGSLWNNPPTPGVSGLYVRRSLDLGVTWSAPPVEVSADAGSTSVPDPNHRFNDRCQITADRFSGSQFQDRVYIAWIKDRGFYMRNDSNNPPLPNGAPPSDIYFAYSTDNGVTFNAPTPATINDNPGTDLANMPVPRVAADGTVYVSWLDYDVWTGGSGTIWLDKSTDGGVTWGNDQPVATINLPPINVTDGFGQQSARAKGAPVLATSPTNANQLYLVYAADPDGPLPDEADIFFIRSTNGGVNWSSPVQLNTDTTTNDQILPWIDVKANGLIDVAWYDRQNDTGSPGIPGDILWDVFLATSVDAGLSFQPEVRLNDQSFGTPSGTWMGEYLGLVVDATHAYVSWASSFSDFVGDVYFDKLANPAGSVPTATATGTAPVSVPTATPTASPAQTPIQTPGQATPTPTVVSICASVPEAGCRSAGVGKSRIVIKDHADDKRDKLVWVWPRGDATSLPDFKDPVSGSATYRLCVYDSSASAQPVMQMDVPPGGTCGPRARPCWKATRSTGYRYRNAAATPNGVLNVLLKTGAAGKAKVVARCKGINMPNCPLPLATPVTVQLVIDDGVTKDCWQTMYSAPPIRNDSLFFKAKQ
jgi:hypothetical protein